MIVARKNGKVSGNPGLINKDPAALAKVQSARDAVRMNAIREKTGDYLPIITSLRPAASWESVADMLNKSGSTRPISGKPWTKDGAIRVAKRLVEAGLADPAVLGTAARKGTADHLLAIISGLVKMNPDATLDQIGENLRAMGQVTPKGSAKWNRSSVEWLLDQARNAACFPHPRTKRHRMKGFMSPIEKKHRSQMNAIMTALTDVFPGYGVALMVFRTGPAGQTACAGADQLLSNADRRSMLVALKEFIARHEGRVVDGLKMPQ